jgi:hypothetical protein
MAIKQHIRNVLGVQEPSFIAFNGFFFEFLTLSILGGRNFLNYISFLMIFNALNVPLGRV